MKVEMLIIAPTFLLTLMATLSSNHSPVICATFLLQRHGQHSNPWYCVQHVEYVYSYTNAKYCIHLQYIVGCSIKLLRFVGVNNYCDKMFTIMQFQCRKQSMALQEPFHQFSEAIINFFRITAQNVKQSKSSYSYNSLLKLALPFIICR